MGQYSSLCEGAKVFGRECGREEVDDGEKQEKDKQEETDNKRSSTRHG